MGVFDFFKRIGKSAVNLVTRVGKTVSRVGRPIVRTVRKGVNLAKHVPIIGQMVKNSPVEKALDIADKVVNTADRVGNKDYVGAINEVMK